MNSLQQIRALFKGVKANVAFSWNLVDDNAAAFEIKEGDSSYFKIVTTNGAEKMVWGKLMSLGGGLEINDTTGDHQYVLAVSELAADRTIALPLLAGNDTFVFADFTQTLNNKTLDTDTQLEAGTGAGRAKLVGVIKIDTTAVGNVDAGEDNLITYALPANSLSANGKGVRIRAWGKTAGNANNKTVKLYFGTSVLITTGALAANNKDWLLDAMVVRTAAATQEAIAQGQANATQLAVDQTEPDQDTTGAITIKCTGEGVATDDIVQEGLLVELLN